ncbi:MAG: hypothetical protein JWO95_1022 [Verrucomicrobiales bacterium]|nr:hypothetical protein [Verrucomicrobiales bacterium]
MSAPVLDQPTVARTHSGDVTLKSSPAPFIAAMLVIILGAAALVYFRAHQKLGAPGVKVAAVPLLDEKGKPNTKQSVPLPENVLDFKSQPIPITEAQLHSLPGDTTYGRRFYFKDEDFHASASVVLMGSDRTSIHKPEFCLPGNGWHIQKKDADDILIPHGQSSYKLPVMKWTVQQEVRGANNRPMTLSGIYVFWFVNDSQITREHSGRMISIAEHMFTKGELERWAYISYLTYCAPGQEEAAYAKLKTLIAASVPEFQLVNGAPTVSK